MSSITSLDSLFGITFFLCFEFVLLLLLQKHEWFECDNGNSRVKYVTN